MLEMAGGQDSKFLVARFLGLCLDERVCAAVEKHRYSLFFLFMICNNINRELVMHPIFMTDVLVKWGGTVSLHGFSN